MLIKNTECQKERYIKKGNILYIIKFGVIISLCVFSYSCSENDTSSKVSKNSKASVINSPTVITKESPKFKIKKTQNNPPVWIVKYIDSLSKGPVKNSPEAIVEFDYRGKSAYYFAPACCGKDGKLYNSEKKLLCDVFRDKSKRKISKCPDFDPDKNFKKVYWQEDRD